MKISFVMLFVSAILLAGCENTPVDVWDEHETLLDRNRARWEMNGADSYKYRVSKFCYECRATGVGEAVVTVKYSKITNVHSIERDQSLHEQYWRDFDTMDQLFNLIEVYLKNPPQVFEVHYNNRLGYPEYIEIDHGYNPDAEVHIVDAGVRVEITEVVLLQ